MSESSTRYLLDANVLIALVVAEHEHHSVAARWFAAVDRVFLCPIVEGSLMRFLLRIGEHASAADSVLRAIRDHERVSFLADAISYLDAGCADLVGHRQVTDAYLAALAGSAGLRLATFDAGLHALRPAHTELLPRQ